MTNFAVQELLVPTSDGGHRGTHPAAESNHTAGLGDQSYLREGCTAWQIINVLASPTKYWAHTWVLAGIVLRDSS